MVEQSKGSRVVVREQCDVSVNIFLAEACAHSVAIDLHFSDHQGRLQTARVRLLVESGWRAYLAGETGQTTRFRLRGRYSITDNLEATLDWRRVAQYSEVLAGMGLYF